jgi:hypothetical protein
VKLDTRRPRFRDMNTPTKVLYLAACGLAIAAFIYLRILNNPIG